MADAKPALLVCDMSKPRPDLVVRDCIDPEQIRNWILGCEENHGERCNKVDQQSAMPTSGLKFIEVINQYIVSAPPNVRYFALIYMWRGAKQMLLTG
jgi:hypothetical protein